MKKKLCILLTLVLVLTAVVAVTATACVTELTAEELWAAAKVPGAGADIHVTLTDPDGTVLYEYELKDGNVTETVAAGITAPPIADKLTGTSGLNFNAGYFSDASIAADGANSVYSANIIQPANFLGISDAVEGKLTIIANRESGALVSTTITYTTASGNRAAVTVVA